MKIYTISGLGADKRVFDYLKLNLDIVHLDWIKNIANESIKEYAFRLSRKINTQEEFILIGVSFGGLVAVEISKILNPKLTILISSAQTRYELPYIYRLLGKTKIVNLVPVFLLKTANSFVTYMFGTKEKKLLKSIIKESDAALSKWAVIQLLNWENITKIKNCRKISGEKDKIIPSCKNDIIIKGGGHLMIVDKAEEISEIINTKISI